MGSIKLSPKHGVNPTIPMCFWCGKEKNEVALMGRIDKEDSQMPMHVIMDYEPCDECKNLFSQGIQVIGFTETPAVKGMFPIVRTEQNTLYPTGSMFVAREEWVKEFLTANDSQEMIENVISKRQLLLPEKIVLEIIEDAKDIEKEEE